MYSIKSQFRRSAGYYEEHICKDCEYCIRVQSGNHAHYKCRKMGISSSASTDIRLKDRACLLFSAKEREQE